MKFRKEKWKWKLWMGLTAEEKPCLAHAPNAMCPRSDQILDSKCDINNLNSTLPGRPQQWANKKNVESAGAAVQQSAQPRCVPRKDAEIRRALPEFGGGEVIPAALNWSDINYSIYGRAVPK